MKVYLEAENDTNDPGRRIWIHSGQKLTIGRTHHADVVVTDSMMSSTHFSLVCNGTHCRLIDLNSSNGTILNGNAIGEALLRNGDEIVAGGTRFSVAVDGAEDDEDAESVLAPPTQPRARSVNANTRKPLACSQQTISNGLVRLSSVQDEARPIDVFHQLASVVGLYALINFNALGEDCPDDASAIFDWLPEDAQREVSPLLLPSESIANPEEVLSDGWNHDALVLFCSTWQPDQVLERLRNVAKNHLDADSPEPENDEPTILGICWPSSMSSMLAQGNADFVQSVLMGMEAVVVENRSPNGWDIFCRAEFVQKLIDLKAIEIR